MGPGDETQVIKIREKGLLPAEPLYIFVHLFVYVTLSFEMSHHESC